jgi:transcriptional regulator with XRE-family HTH domain
MVDMPTARAIKAARVLAGLTGAELAKRAGIDPGTLSRLENGGVAAVSGKNFEAVINALRKAGVEVEGTTIKLVGKPRR